MMNMSLSETRLRLRPTCEMGDGGGSCLSMLSVSGWFTGDFVAYQDVLIFGWEDQRSCIMQLIT